MNFRNMVFRQPFYLYKRHFLNVRVVLDASRYDVSDRIKVPTECKQMNVDVCDTAVMQQCNLIRAYSVVEC